MGTLATTGKTEALGGITDGPVMYVAFVTSNPSAFTTMAQVVAAELSVAGYARVPITWGTPSGASVANTGALVTPSLTGATGATALAGICIVTSASGSSGSLIAVTTITGADLTPSAGEAVRIAAGALTVTF